MSVAKFAWPDDDPLKKNFFFFKNSSLIGKLLILKTFIKKKDAQPEDVDLHWKLQKNYFRDQIYEWSPEIKVSAWRRINHDFFSGDQGDGKTEKNEKNKQE